MRTQEAPQETVARRFMEHKGLEGVQPVDVEKVRNEYIWYFTYYLPEGQLVLEVSFEDGTWDASVWTFGEPVPTSA